MASRTAASKRGLLSIRAFAQVIGVDHKAIIAAIKTGRLVNGVICNADGKVIGIDEEVGREDWEMNNPRPVNSKVKELNDQDLPLPAGLSYADARAVRENYQARLSKLAYEERMGRLVDSETVRRQAFELGRLLRSAVLVIPDRISHELAAEGDSNKVHLKLSQALIEALEQVANDPSAGSDTPDATA